MTARKARNHQMRLSSLLYPHTAVFAKHKQRIAFSADSAFVFRWQAYFCCHSDFSGGFHVVASELRVASAGFLSLVEQGLYALLGYLLCGGIHF